MGTDKNTPDESWPPAKEAGRVEHFAFQSQIYQHEAGGNFPSFFHSKPLHLEVRIRRDATLFACSSGGFRNTVIALTKSYRGIKMKTIQTALNY